MRYIVAASYREFRAWCSDHDVHPGSPQVRYVRWAYNLRGVGGDAKIVLVDGWERHRDAEAIRDILAWLTGRRPS